MMLIRSRQLVWGLAALFAAIIVVGCTQDSATDESGRLNNPIVLGETGTHPGQFVYPRAMDIYHDEQGRAVAIVIDKTARMQTIDLTTGEQIGETLMPEFSNGMPTGVTVGTSLHDPDQLAAYVPDTHEHRVLVYSLPLDGSDPIFSFGEFGENARQFIYPTDVIIQTKKDGSVEALLISEYGGNDRITRYTIDRATENIDLLWDAQIGVASETIDGSDAPVALSRPQSIGLWNNGGTDELIIVDSSHHRVGRVGLDGSLIAWYESDHDPEHPHMSFPYGLRVLGDGTALISEFGGNCVRLIELESGKTIQRIGVAGRSDGELATPWTSGVIDGELVILDSGNNRIQKIAFDTDDRIAGVQQ